MQSLGRGNCESSLANRGGEATAGVQEQATVVPDSLCRAKHARGRPHIGRCAGRARRSLVHGPVVVRAPQDGAGRTGRPLQTAARWLTARAGYAPRASAILSSSRIASAWALIRMLILPLMKSATPTTDMGTDSPSTARASGQSRSF